MLFWIIQEGRTKEATTAATTTGATASQEAQSTQTTTATAAAATGIFYYTGRLVVDGNAVICYLDCGGRVKKVLPSAMYN